MKFKKLMNMMNGDFEVFTKNTKHTITPICRSSDWENHAELNDLNVRSFSVEPNLNDNGSINWKNPCRIIVTFNK